MPAAFFGTSSDDAQRRRARGKGVARRLGRERIEDLIDRRIGEVRAPPAAGRRTCPDRSRSPPAAARRCPRRCPAPCGSPAVVFAGMSSSAGSTSSGGETWTFQSAPTIVCAASSWLVRTIARYDVETTSRPIASSEQERRREAGAGGTAQLAAGQVDRRRASIARSGGPSDGRRTAGAAATRNEAANSSSVGASSTSGSIVPAPGVGFVPPRSWMNAKIPTGSTISSTGTRDSSGRSSRDKRPPLLQHGPRDVGEREQQQDERADRGRDARRAPRADGVQLHGEQHAGERRTVRSAGEARQPQARSAGRAGTRPSRRAPPARPAPASSVPRGRSRGCAAPTSSNAWRVRVERGDAGEDGERHGADLEHDEQDRHAQVRPRADPRSEGACRGRSGPWRPRAPGSPCSWSSIARSCAGIACTSSNGTPS